MREIRLIIVDGLDCVGKDTHAQLIKKRYEKKGERVALRSHPESDNFFGQKTKKALLGKGKINRLIASIFYIFDVLHSLRFYYRTGKYDTIILVRYLMGTAYLPPGLAQFAYKAFLRFVPTSQYMFFLDAQPEDLVERLKMREEQEMFETYDELVRVRKIALSLALDWYIIDTTPPIEDTFECIEDVLNLLDYQD